jgi:hypothetical protein
MLCIRKEKNYSAKVLSWIRLTPRRMDQTEALYTVFTTSAKHRDERSHRGSQIGTGYLDRMSGIKTRLIASTHSTTSNQDHHGFRCLYLQTWACSTPSSWCDMVLLEPLGPQQSTFATRASWVAVDRKSPRYASTTGMESLPAMVPRLRYVSSPYYSCSESDISTDSDIIHLSVAGKSIVIIDKYETAMELLNKRAAIYSNR